MRHIAILMHNYQRSMREHYLIAALAEEWKRIGFGVSCAFGLSERVHGDLLIPQVDLTRTPDRYMQRIRAFPAVVNRDLQDISKRRISAQLLRQGADYRGAVIVKTNRNGGGMPEQRLLEHRYGPLARLWRNLVPRAERVLGRAYSWRKVMSEYPVFNSLSEVPAGAFSNLALVVERFLPEREGERYFMRHYLFLGDRTRNVRVAGRTPLLKRAECELVEEGLPVPEEAVALRRRLGIDYGKIDYVVHDGQVVLLDVNRTPCVPGPPEKTAKTVRDLFEGIWALLPR